MGLFNFLFGRRDGRDGSSAEKAIVVGSVGEEYDWIRRHHPDFRFEMQSLCEINGKPYDVLAGSNARGEKQEFYFDISRFFGG